MHTIGQAITFIEKTFGQCKLTHSSREANVVCPVCEETTNTNKKKLAIRTDAMFAKCWVCGFKSRNLIFLLKKYKPEFLQEYAELFQDSISINSDDYNKIPDDFKISLPHGFMMLAEFTEKEIQGIEVRKVLNYLSYKRKITKRDLWYYKFGITLHDYEYANRVLIPSYDSSGILNFFTSRTYSKSTNTTTTRYKNPLCEREKIIFNEININWKEELTLVEGPFDLTKVNDNAVPLLGKELTENYSLFHKIIENNTPIVLSLDNDAFENTIKISNLLLKYDIALRICSPPKTLKDFGEAPDKSIFENALQKAFKVNNMTDILKLRIERLCQ